MNELLKKLKLIDYLKTELQIDKNEFAKQLSLVTDRESVGMFLNPFDVFSTSKNEFRGQVNEYGFKLQRRRRLFDTNGNMAVATGKLFEKDGQLTIETEINGFNNFFIFFYAILIVFYSIFIIVGFIFPNDGVGFFIIPFILLHATLMFALPYFMMRRSVKRLKYELEREFFYLTKK